MKVYILEEGSLSGDDKCNILGVFARPEDAQSKAGPELRDIVLNDKGESTWYGLMRYQLIKAYEVQ